MLAIPYCNDGIYYYGHYCIHLEGTSFRMPFCN